MDLARIGFIGVGRMGGPMAGRLLEAGFKVTAFDANAEALKAVAAKGADVAGSAAEVASTAEVVLVSLPRPDIVLAVALDPGGIVDGTRRTVFVDLSTTGPQTAKAVAAALAERGVTAIDSPVSGGVAGAVAGTLAVMTSGPREICEGLRPVLDVIGKVFYVGIEPGMGQMMKLVNNLLTATAIAATSEAMVLGVKAGLDPATMLDVINAGSGRNTASMDKFPRSVLPRTFKHGFAMDLMYKDVALCVAEADALKVPMWVGGAVKQIWLNALAEGGPDQDFTELVKLVEGWAGVTVGGNQGEV
jgi:3-hydroxyisobutyrate dehydrogenase-like beta-hydroxyacid dehydrogenase